MNFPFFKKNNELSALVWSERGADADKGSSSQVNDGLLAIYDGWVQPVVPFKKCQEYYLTVGKVSNAVESFVNQVINRDWYFDGNEDEIKKLEEWEKKYHLSNLFEWIVRDWLTSGSSIIGKSDYRPVQMETIIGLKRNSVEVLHFGQLDATGQVKPLKGSDYFFSKYIEFSRSAWGLPLYVSSMTSFIDIDGKPAKPMLELYRQSIQDNSKIHHRMGSPRTVWFFDMAKDLMDKEIKPLLKGMNAGDRLLLNKKPELVQETVDGKTRFTEATQQLTNEVEASLQSSSSRLITQPSAMADAREAGSQDDERVKGIMEKLRRFVNEQIIPHVLGKTLEQCETEFKWGTKDSFNLNYPEGLRGLFQDGIIDEEIVIHILTNRLNWDLPDDMIKNLKQKLVDKRKLSQQTQRQLPDNSKDSPDNQDDQENPDEDLVEKKERLQIELLKTLLKNESKEG